MAKRGKLSLGLSDNAFGRLVKAFREQRGWSQGDLGERWGHSREYVSMVEQGRRKLNSIAQVVKLADILNIPQEKLEAIGRGIPERKVNAQTFPQADNSLLQMLLASSRDTVRLSYMTWLADQYPAVEGKLRNLILDLDSALTAYHGEFAKPARQLLAYTHQMLGKIAFDRLDYAAASGHYSEMIDLGKELNDTDIIALAMVRQGDVFRKKGRYETSLRCFEATRPYADAADLSVQGIRHINIARAHYFLGDEKSFLQSIHTALDIATHMKKNDEGLAYWFSRDVVLQFQASGYTALLKPEKALEIYKELEHPCSFRPLRDQGAYMIEKARAYLELGDLKTGIRLSLKGLQSASEYRSKRHIARLDATYNRLLVTPFGKDKQLHMLRDALMEVRREQGNW